MQVLRPAFTISGLVDFYSTLPTAPDREEGSTDSEGGTNQTPARSRKLVNFFRTPVVPLASTASSDLKEDGPKDEFDELANEVGVLFWMNI